MKHQSVGSYTIKQLKKIQIADLDVIVQLRKKRRNR